MCTDQTFLSHVLLCKQHQSYLAWCCFFIQRAKSDASFFHAIKDNHTHLAYDMQSEWLLCILLAQKQMCSRHGGNQVLYIVMTFV